MFESLGCKAKLYALLELLEQEAAISTAIIVLQHQQQDLAAERKLKRSEIEALRREGD